MNSEALLEHSKFIRSLARSLVLDESSADDLTQKTWLAALKKPPKEDSPPMGWLSKVVHNLARMEKRSSVRRYKREKVVAVPEAVRSTEDVFERQAQTQLIFDAVMTLKDPYRSAILLRFYDDMPPRKIAREIDAPVTTVKTWLQRGQEQLRKKLDSEFGGDRESWKLALAPIAGLTFATSAASASTTATTVAVGSGAGVAALKLGLVGLVAATALIFLTTVWNILPDENEPDLPGLAEGRVLLGSIQAAPDDLLANDGGRSAFGGEEVEKVAIRPTNSILRGQVVDLVTGEPIESFDLVLSPVVRLKNAPQPNKTNQMIRESDDGSFALPVEDRSGRFTLSVRTSRHTTERVNLWLPLDHSEPELTIPLDPGEQISGRVVDAETGEPIEGAIVGIENNTALDEILLGLSGGGIHDRTDVDGRFTLGGLERGRSTLVASHPRFVQASASAWSGTEGSEIRLVKGPKIFGTALSDEGKPLQGVIVTVSQGGISLPRVVLTGPDGCFETPPVMADSEIVIVASRSLEDSLDPGQSSAALFTTETKKIQVYTEDVEVNFGISEEYLTWTGTIFDKRGDPVGGWLIEASAPSLNVIQRAFCDSEGQFEFRKIQPETEYVITLFLPGYESQIPMGICKFDSVRSGIVEEDLIVSGGSIAGRIFLEPDGIGARSGIVQAMFSTNQASSGLFFQAAVGKEGSFRMRGLPPGAYKLTYYYSPPLTVERDSVRQGFVDETGATRSFEVGEGLAIENADLFVPTKGILRLTGTGFEKNDLLSLRLTLGGDDLSSQQPISKSLSRKIATNGDLEFAYMLQQGIWTVEFLLSGNRAALREIEIVNDEIAKLEIHRNELRSDALTTRLEGTIRDGGGSPISGASVYLTQPGPSPGSILPEIATNTEGEFTFHGLPAGVWELRVRTREETPFVKKNVEFFLPDQIANDPQRETQTVGLNLPSGRAFVRLCDSVTNRPLADKLPWTVYAVGIGNNGKTVVSGYGSEIDLSCLPEGPVQLVIKPFGYEPIETKQFHAAPGERRDLGKIYLERAEKN